MWFLLAAFANDSIKAVVSAGLLRRFLPGRGIRFDRLHDFWIYLAAVVVAAPALSGFAGAATWLARGQKFWPAWRNWFLGDALANLVLTPLLLWLALNWRQLTKTKPLRYLEGVVAFSGLFFAARLAHQQIVMTASDLDLYAYIPVIFVLVTAVRFGPPGASASLAIISGMWIIPVGATQTSSSGSGGSPALLLIQLLLIVIALPVLSLSVLMEEQRTTERSLRESEARFRNMADTAPVMIWISGPDKFATFFNRGWLQFTGRGMESELGYGWIANVHPEQRGDCLATYSSSFDKRSSWFAECQIRRADGEYRWVLCTGAPRLSSEGAFEGFIVSSSDITDLKRAQEASLARQKLESLGVLAGGIAHDFNNLLGGIYTSAEIAEACRFDGLFPTEEIEAIKATAMRASAIVRQLMVYAGHERSDVAPLDLSELVDEMLDLIRISVSKSAVLKTDLATDLPAILGSASQVQQVLMNLVLNASDALRGKEGVITVSTSLVLAAGNSNSSSSVAAVLRDYVCLEVSDTGCGMSTETQAKIFDPFFTTKSTGRGLGLAVVQGAVLAHGGEIELTSAQGRGTTFRILWPPANSFPDRSAPVSPSRASTLTPPIGGSVLLVEDEEILRQGIATLLRKAGLTVTEASDGTTAVDTIHASEKKIDLVLLDLTVPGASSSTVIAETTRLRPNTRILLMSAYTREMAGAVGEAAQVRGFIRKPFQIHDLLAAIRETLSVEV
jgi:PAS domain S-box-containing protein